MVTDDGVGISMAIHPHPKRNDDVLVVTERHFVPIRDVVNKLTSFIDSNSAFRPSLAVVHHRDVGPVHQPQVSDG